MTNTPSARPSPVADPAPGAYPLSRAGCCALCGEIRCEHPDWIYDARSHLRSDPASDGRE